MQGPSLGMLNIPHTNQASLTRQAQPDSPKKALAVGWWRWIPMSVHRKLKGSSRPVKFGAAAVLSVVLLFFLIGKPEDIDGDGLDFHDFQSYGEAAMHPDVLLGAAATASANWVNSVFEIVSSTLVPHADWHCSNKCGQAQDGVCNDGRPNLDGTLKPGKSITCDLGADCKDCGPWHGSYSQRWYQNFNQTPLAYLYTEHNLVSLVRRTNTTPSFLFPYANPKVDMEVSKEINKFGVFEGGITAIFRHILGQGSLGRCVDPETGERQLVLDVGANFGYFAVYAAMHGCRVIAWEPVPMFRAFMEWAVAANNVSHLVDIRPFAAGETTGQEIFMQVPVSGVLGTASVDGMNLMEWDKRTTIKAVTERIDDVVKEDVIILKVDVEGYEPQVMKGATQLLTQHYTENIIMEYSPGVVERLNKPHLLWNHPLMLASIALQGYQIQWLPDGFTKAPYPVRPDTGIPASEEVTLANLMHDVQDVILFSQDKLGCEVSSLPPSKLLKYKNWRKCNIFPFDSNPRSFRSAFIYNTNVWATKLKVLQDVSTGPIGLAPLDGAPLTNWTVQGLRGQQGFGLGMQWCAEATPKTQVRYRCPCSNPSMCGKEERTVKEAAAAGGMPQNYQLPADFKLPNNIYPLPRLEYIDDAFKDKVHPFEVAQDDFTMATKK